MTDKELKRLKRLDLLEILIAQDQEIKELKEQLAITERQLQRDEAIISVYLQPDSRSELLLQDQIHNLFKGNEE